MISWAVAVLAAAVSAQVIPPNLIHNGDARGGSAGWQRHKYFTAPETIPPRDSTIETCDDGFPCFVMRNGAGWVQQVAFFEDHAGKFLLLIARGSSERAIPGNITDVPYLWARLVSDERPSNRTILQGMGLWPDAPNRWGTMHGIFPVPEGVRGLTLMLGQGQRKGTPRDGSAARVKDVEARLFDTRAEAEAYVKIYNALYDR